MAKQPMKDQISPEELRLFEKQNEIHDQQIRSKNERWTQEPLENNSNWLQKIFFTWTGCLINLGKLKSEITDKDLLAISPVERFDYNVAQFENNIQELIKKGTPKNKLLSKALWKLVKWNVIVGVIFMIISNILQFGGPLFLKQILIYLKSDNEPFYKGLLYGLGIFLSFFLRSIIQQNGFHILNRVGFATLNGIEGMIYKKIMQLKCTSKQFVDTGKIMNLATVDVMQIYMFSQFGSFMITSPIMIIVALGLIIAEIGPVGFVGVVILFFGTILTGSLGGKQMNIRKQLLGYSDKRGKLMSEYISGIRILKYYGWEQFAMNTIQEIRQKESSIIFKMSFLRQLLDLFTQTIPTLIVISAFGLYVAIGNELTPEKAFSVLGYFNLMQLPIRMMGFTIQALTNLYVSLRRINMFYGWEDKVDDGVDQDIEIGAIQIQGGQFAWDSKTANEYNKVYLKFQEQISKAKQQKGKQQVKQQEQKERQILTILKDINLEVKNGQFVGIIGQVGSGKSSLLNSMINEMHLEQGKISINNRNKIAFITQQAWLMNTTLRNNILFGHEYDKQKYEKVLEICQLNSDIEILEGKDLTEIGERGINLSGGQKQRVAIARAIYSDSDIYLIDDCLSALDSFVGKKIYQQVLMGYLKNKTRVFVTHGLQYIKECDHVYVIKDGQIVQQGSEKQLVQMGGEYNVLTMKHLEKQKQEEQKQEEEEEEQQEQSVYQLVEQSMLRVQDIDSESISQISVADEHQKYNNGHQQNQFQEGQIEMSKKQSLNKMKSGESLQRSRKMSNDQQQKSRKISNQDQANIEKGKLIKEEKKFQGSVKFDVYKYYMKSAGWGMVFGFLVAQAVGQFLIIFNDVWLSYWSNNKYKKELEFYLIGYFVLAVITALFLLAKGVLFGQFTSISAIKNQKKLVYAVMRSPMSWFDVTPAGRILSRTNKDQDDMDNQLPWTLNFCLSNIFSIVAFIITVSVILNWFILVGIFTSLFYISTVKKYLRVAREIKRIESLKRAPALSLIGETANGQLIIRSFKQEGLIMKTIQERFDDMVKASSNNMLIGRWISIRLDLISAVLVGSTGILAVLSKQTNYTDNRAYIGVAITNVLKITGILSFTIKILAETELAMNGVERIKEYVEKKDLEKEWDEPKVGIKEWPMSGEIEVKNLSLRYKHDSPIILKNLDFKLRSFEKVGVVGRTGSGKSTLTLGLLRILELCNDKEGQKGQIIIDGVDISEIGLHQLRHKISIIPQDPFLFTGSLRKNVDPFNEYSDSQIIESLKQVTMWDQITNDSIKSDQDKLEFQIQDGGSNFSLGQRQLICISRCILRKSRIILMDEATASIDENTDRIIQQTIKQTFKDTTILTIAHRVNTIINYDRLIVLDYGKIIQFDTPYNLLTQQGHFRDIVMENGQEYYQKLLDQTNKQ